MEENKKRSLFSRVVNSKASVILYIITLAIFYFGAIVGGMFVANQVLPFEELIAECGELIKNNLGVFVIYAIFAIIIFFSILPIVGIFVSFLPCIVISIILWIIFIIIVWLSGFGNKEDLL